MLLDSRLNFEGKIVRPSVGIQKWKRKRNKDERELIARVPSGKG